MLVFNDAHCRVHIRKSPNIQVTERNREGLCVCYFNKPASVTVLSKYQVKRTYELLYVCCSEEEQLHLSRKYVIVFFPKENSVDVAPTNWMASFQLCLWPRKGGVISPSVLASRREEVDATFKVHEVQIIHGYGR